MSQDAERKRDPAAGAAAASTGLVPEIPPRILSPFDFLKAGAFVLFWLVPIMYVNLTNGRVDFEKITSFAASPLTNKDSIPRYLNNQYRIACLFTNSVVQWKNLYVQVQLQGGEEWIAFHESEYAPMHCFGYRTRIKRLYNESKLLLDQPGHRKAKNRCPGCKDLTLRREHMATFIGRRYEEVHPESAPVRRVRFVEATYSVGQKEIAKPAGHWRVPPLDEVPVKQRRVRSTHEVAE